MHCFKSVDYLQGGNLRFLIGATIAHVHYSLLQGVVFGESGVQVFVLVMDVLLLLDLEYRSGSFLFLVLFLFFVVCIRIAIRVLHCCRGWV
jgi:hypothetical protein